jgi:hypothetical protein
MYHFSILIIRPGFLQRTHPPLGVLCCGYGIRYFSRDAHSFRRSAQGTVDDGGYYLRNSTHQIREVPPCFKSTACPTLAPTCDRYSRHDCCLSPPRAALDVCLGEFYSLTLLNNEIVPTPCPQVC